ncbi:MAG: NAD(P)(+) transhydrogenase (Re/Si-specific) subunit alpha [Woeseiaceae bacterium]|jgi:NAD(P) transhydrogenase subunit alpha|nr:NAD(P)(+) transhydrogenase (Re/Si-specific) subunit alpha [Woeseiaceae bacterium]MDG1712593.1 NAD(P) transhydrogenase subunit alpha [Woeseiaceae bacterium]|tara:strand:+ start:2555 stop:3682 length:1128 start_codon:yes stop_codon:yes gene_type:complete
MSFTIGVLKETAADETRVAITPEIAKKLTQLNVVIIMEKGAGSLSNFLDEEYEGVNFDTASEVLKKSNLLLAVQPITAEQSNLLGKNNYVVGMIFGHLNKKTVNSLKTNEQTSFAMELMPRISRAQSMDVLSSQAAAAGYQAVLIAANTLDKFFPMLTTAAGTIRPAQILIIGAGVAGLQAIATAKRLGAIVKGYDVRSATKEQIESLGAKFVETGVSAEGKGGYARELTDEEKLAQQDALEKEIANCDVVISTAAIPGKPAPKIIRASAVRAMKPGAVIVDLAAETGGNCELTKAGETVLDNNVKIVGPTNLAASLGKHASEMYARNLFNFLAPAIKDGDLIIDWEDEVFIQSNLTRDGKIVHESSKEAIEGGL